MKFIDIKSNYFIFHSLDFIARYLFIQSSFSFEWVFAEQTISLKEANGILRTLETRRGLIYMELGEL